MKMKLKRVVCFVGFALALAGTASSDSGKMSVQVKEAQLRSTPSFLGAIVGPVAYGEQLDTVQKQGDWFDVKNSRNLRGWIHESALTTKQVVLNPGAQTQPAASNQEIALAGKGFNSSVEAQYRKSNATIDYTWVDRMEAVRVSRDQMMSFLESGKVKPTEGGRK
jgi:SH3-like domain-containing protein